VPACNEDRLELKIAGEISLAIGGFVIPPLVVRDSSGYKIISGHFQYHAVVVARQLNPKAGEHIPAIMLENDSLSNAQDVEIRGIDLDRAPSLKLDGVF
jgi:hypothetical protein